MPDPRAVIVDVGGVLTTPLRDSFAAFCDTEGIELAALEAAIGDLLGVADDEHPVAQLESGLMELGAVEAWLASDLNRCLGINIAGDGIARRLLGGVSLEERTLKAVARIRGAGLRAGLLSNSWGSTDYGPLGELFDAVVISGNEGMRKPDPRIYLLAARAVGRRLGDVRIRGRRRSAARARGRLGCGRSTTPTRIQRSPSSKASSVFAYAQQSREASTDDRRTLSSP